eukprot:368859_1
MMRAIALLAVSAVASAVIPTFPDAWSAENIDAIQIVQGGVTNPDGSVCCPPTSPQCKIQSAYSAGMMYWDTAGQRTAEKNPDGSGIVSLYADAKEYQVDATGACQAFCPLPPGKLTPFAIDPNA